MAEGKNEIHSSLTPKARLHLQGWAWTEVASDIKGGPEIMEIESRDCDVATEGWWRDRNWRVSRRLWWGDRERAENKRKGIMSAREEEARVFWFLSHSWGYSCGLERRAEKIGYISSVRVGGFTPRIENRTDIHWFGSWFELLLLLIPN